MLVLAKTIPFIPHVLQAPTRVEGRMTEREAGRCRPSPSQAYWGSPHWRLKRTESMPPRGLGDSRGERWGSSCPEEEELCWGPSKLTEYGTVLPTEHPAL